MPTVADIMDAEPVVAHPEDSVETLLRTLREHELPGIPVVEHGRLVGVVTRLDVLAALVAAE